MAYRFLCKILYLICFTLVLTSCLKIYDSVTPLDAALKVAGDNRVELEKILSRYSREDSLKYRAACFLIENMPWHYYYEGNQLNNYLNYFRLLRENKNTAIRPGELSDSITSLYGSFFRDSLFLRHDILTLDSAYICSNIDWAFKVWQEQPWGKNVSFDDFCEYVLPYRIGDEKPEYWRQQFYEEYNELLLNELRQEPPEMAEDPINAVLALMRHIADREEVYFTTTAPARLPHVGPSIARFKSGNCGTLTDYAIYVCRALGIPCHIDFVPVRGNDNVGHFWISYQDKEKELYMQDFPDNVVRVRESGFRYDPKTKVYRYTFSYNREMKKNMAALENSCPEFFVRPIIKDVTYPYTEYYMEKVNIPVSRLYNSKMEAKIAYLCTARHQDWMPVTWAPVQRNEVTFRAIQKGDILRVATWENNRLVCQSDPFRINPFTNEVVFYTGRDSVQDVVLCAKFSTGEEDWFRDRMYGGVFEGSNDAGFVHKDTLHVINRMPPRLCVAVKPKIKNKYRYVRFYGAAESRCNVAEVALYETDHDTVPLQGKVIGTPGSFDPIRSQEYTNVFDGKTWTSFDYKEASGGWAGLDFGTPKAVSVIIFSPRNRDNYIRPGDVFELFYLNREWQSLGIVTSHSDSLLYRGVPKDALLYLKNHSRGSQERIFVYEKGKQIWR